MHVREASEADRQRWDALVAATEGGSFLQSWGWGEFQKELHVPHWRLLAEEGDTIVGVALVIKRELPLGKCWLYVPAYAKPASPAGRASAGEAWRVLQEQLRELARGEKAIFMRADPRLPKFNFGAGWKKAKREVQPRETSVMDLHKSEEELLAGMHSKTRYNIRLAEKHGVWVRFSRDEKDIESFLQLAQAVSARSPFRYHSADYYRAMRNALGDMFEIAVAELEGKPLAVHLLISFDNTATYVHGASSRNKREVMAPHLLQWTSIRRAKQQGKRWFDFYGIGSQWSGITRFKEGFGGEWQTYVGAWDYPLSPFWYFLYSVRH